MARQHGQRTFGRLPADLAPLPEPTPGELHDRLSAAGLSQVDLRRFIAYLAGSGSPQSMERTLLRLLKEGGAGATSTLVWTALIRLLTVPAEEEPEPIVVPPAQRSAILRNLYGQSGLMVERFAEALAAIEENAGDADDRDERMTRVVRKLETIENEHARKRQ